MAESLYEATIPMFLHYLGRLHALLDYAEEYTRSKQIAESDLLNARLAPDMLPLAKQVEIAANFSLRASYPLAGRAIPPYGEFPTTFAGLQARLAHVSNLLKALAPDEFAESASRLIESQAGEALVTLRASEFLHLYAVPNFFFHLSTAYGILRNQGVAIGKAQFDGFHLYPSTPQ